MADKSMFSMDLGPAFEQFKKGFDDYSTKMGASLKAWQSTSKQLNDTKNILKSLGQAAEGPAAATKRLNDEVAKHAEGVKSALGYWSRMTDQINQATEAARKLNVETGRRVAVDRPTGFGRGAVPEPEGRKPSPRGGGDDKQLKNLASAMEATEDSLKKISTSMVKSTMALGGAGTEALSTIGDALKGISKMNIPAAIATGVGAVIAAVPLATMAAAPDVAALSKASLSLGGVDPSVLRAARAASKSWMPGSATETLSNIVQAGRGGYNSPQYQAYIRVYGGAAAAQAEMAKPKLKQMEDYFRTVGGMMNRMPDTFAGRQQQGMLLQRLAPEAIADRSQIYAMATLLRKDPGQFDKYFRGMDELAKSTKLAPGISDKMTDVADTMASTGEKVEVGVVRNVAGAAPATAAMLKKAGDAVNQNWVGKLGKSADVVTHSFHRLADAIGGTATIIHHGHNRFGSVAPGSVDTRAPLIRELFKTSALAAPTADGPSYWARHPGKERFLHSNAPPIKPAVPPPALPVAAARRRRRSGWGLHLPWGHHPADADMPTAEATPDAFMHPYSGAGWDLPGGGHAADPLATPSKVPFSTHGLMRAYSVFSRITSNAPGSALGYMSLIPTLSKLAPYLGMAGAASVPTLGLGASAAGWWASKKWARTTGGDPALDPFNAGGIVPMSGGIGSMNQGQASKANASIVETADESKTQTSILKQINEKMERWLHFGSGGGGPLGGAAGGWGGAGGRSVVGGGMKTLGPGGVDITGAGGGAAGTVGGAGGFLARHFGLGGKGAPPLLRARGTGGGGATPSAPGTGNGAAGGGVTYTGGIAHDPSFSHEAAYRDMNPFNVNLTAYGKSLGGTLDPLKDQPLHAHFTSAAAGIKAGQEALMNRFKRGDNTIAKFYRPGAMWSTAPGAAERIAKQMGMGLNDPLNLADPKVMEKYSRVLIMNEGRTGARLLAEAGTPTAVAAAGGGGAAGGGTGWASAMGTDIAPGATKGMTAYDPAQLAEINKFMSANGVPINAKNTQWCAAWVNAQLAKEGIQGTTGKTRLMAGSFEQWGKGEEAGQASRGDIMMVKSASDYLGASHVGRFTGKTRVGPGGVMQYEMYAGNAGDRPGTPRNDAPNRSQFGTVGRSWYNANAIDFRAPTQEMLAAANANKAAVAAAAPATAKGQMARGLTGHGGHQTEDQQVASSQPLSMHNWQQNRATAFTLHNKTGSDVHIAASTMSV